jgi:hypothetical protein
MSEKKPFWVGIVVIGLIYDIISIVFQVSFYKLFMINITKK